MWNDLTKECPGAAVIGTLIIFAVLTALGVSGCVSPHDVATASLPITDPACPAELQDMVELSASAVPRTIPADIAVDEGAVKAYGRVGRRIMVAIVPKDAARGVRVLSSTLSITPLGGMFQGWAELSGQTDSAATRAIEIVPGRLRVTPFLGEATLHAQTTMLDVLVMAGGSPADEMVVDTDPLWSSNGQPVPADALHITLTPVRQPTVYDYVDARVTLTLVVVASRHAHTHSECSIEAGFTLVDANTVRPPLWDIATSIPGVPRTLWLALYDSKTGPIPAIFTSPAAATGFARWLRQAKATQVGPYQLELFRPKPPERKLSKLPIHRLVVDDFHPLSTDDLDALKVGRIAEP